LHRGQTQLPEKYIKGKLIMLSDEKALGEAQVTAKQAPVPSLEGFYYFAAMKPYGATYVYKDCHVCACQQYAAEIGDLESWHGRMICFSQWTLLDRIAAVEPHTFGALAERLKGSLVKAARIRKK
jgi:hypothetical protein